MPRFITVIAVLSSTSTVLKTLAVPLNGSPGKTHGGLSSIVQHEPTNTFDDDRPNKSQSQDTKNGTTEANALSDLHRLLLRHYNFTPMSGTTNIDAVNNGGTETLINQVGHIESNK
jgi:hypothetical protein